MTPAMFRAATSARSASVPDRHSLAFRGTGDAVSDGPGTAGLPEPKN